METFYFFILGKVNSLVLHLKRVVGIKNNLGKESEPLKSSLNVKFIQFLDVNLVASPNAFTK